MNEAVGRGTVLAGRYRVVQPVTSDLVGSSAWQATDQILDRPVRVRVLESGAVAPALDAARRAALVTDPRLVRVLDVGTHEGVGYVVTEQVSGPSLAELVAHGPLAPDQARAIVGEAASALEVARRRGVHHLALRPSIVHVSPDGRVLLSGLALDAALRGEATGDARATTRADTVGLVRLLYTALTGLWPADPRQPWPTGDGPAQAPLHEGSPVPPVELAPGVPADLDTLCAVTLGPYEDGPHSPGELVRELEPWGELAPELLDGPPTVLAPPVLEPLVDEPPYVDHDAQDTAPVRVQRQSARTAFDELQAPGANRPGTPPPAAPTRTSAFGGPAAAAGGAVAGAAAAEAAGYGVPPAGATTPMPPVGATTPLPPVGATAPMPPASYGAAPPSPYGQAQPPAGYGQAPPAAYGPVPPAAPQGALHQPAPASFGPSNGYQGGYPQQGPPDEPLDFDGFAVEDVPASAPARRRFDPTALVLGIVGVVVVIGVIIAFKSLFSSFDPKKPSADESNAPQQTASAPAESAPPAAQPTQAAPPAAGGVPTIATAITIDPSDDDGEHEEDVAKAYDGDPSTFWYTQTYKRDDFAGFKEGVGYAITLAAPANVKTVTLHSNMSGGHVEVRATDATAPTSGPVLASGAFGPETVLTLDPATDTQSLVLWITQLPAAPEGGFRVELTEISLS